MTHSHAKRTHVKRAVVAVAAGVALSATLTTFFAGASTPSKTRLSEASPPAGSPQMLAAMQRDLGLTTGEAQARLVQEADAVRKVQTVRRASGASWAGAWFDAEKGRLAVAVTSPAAARQAKATGALATVVSRSQAELRGVVDQLERGAAGVPPAAVTGWGVDPRTNNVVITVTRQSEADLFLNRARALDLSVRVVERSGVQRQQEGEGEVRGGDAWTPGNESSCSIGFAATGADGSKHFLTAGHCTDNDGQAAFHRDGSQIGVSNGSTNGIDGDFGKVDVTSADFRLTSTVNSFGQGTNVTVSGVGEALVGQSVCRSGVTTGFRCGTVQAVDQTVNFGGGKMVGGLSETDACSAGGDSGGSYVAGTTAVGTHVSGAGGCNSANPVASFQPVQEALTAFGLTLVTGEENAGGTGNPPGNNPT